MSPKMSQSRRDAIQHKLFVSMLHILWIFGIPAVGAYFAGTWLDTTYDMRPIGSMLAGVVALTISWVFIIRLYRRLVAEYRAIEVEEAMEEEQTKNSTKEI